MSGSVDGLAIALDRPPPGWRLANPDVAAAFVAALRTGASVQLRIDAADAEWLTALGLRFADRADLSIHVTDRVVADDRRTLIYHPQVLAIGVGAERDVAPDEMSTLVRATLESAGLSPHALAGVFSIDLRADEPAVQALASSLGVPARFFSAARLAEEAPRLLNPSETVRRATGCPGVAEGAALAAAGPDAVLIVPKRKSARATCAVARAPAPIFICARNPPR